MVKMDLLDLNLKETGLVMKNDVYLFTFSLKCLVDSLLFITFFVFFM